MPISLPENVREQIRERVYEKADEANYLAQSRADNGSFMNALVRNPEIGGVLRDYMPEGRIKTYIKDAVLNRYAKDKRAEALENYSPDILIAESFGNAIEIEEADRVALYKSTERIASYCVIGTGSNDKWETALRHALVYVANLPEETQRQDVRIALRCTSPRGKLSMSDKNQIKDALMKIGVEYYCIEF